MGVQMIHLPYGRLCGSNDADAYATIEALGSWDWSQFGGTLLVTTGGYPNLSTREMLHLLCQHASSKKLEPSYFCQTMIRTRWDLCNIEVWQQEQGVLLEDKGAKRVAHCRHDDDNVASSLSHEGSDLEPQTFQNASGKGRKPPAQWNAPNL
ncbi:hypothetical protein LTR10_018489 [Elasticomyces elasticus]|uniref:Uncharacterized protein n=1 Tax=Exophiala sideris TaxID=1016849 RepID=A0ABR0J1A3_9EURO|nr:hypothetical protein LTR10_018489 [Elasticomyces elasticus]KAK5023918.1 hypothetical protein LTS07_009044 [Exophiala sideris]KAK5030065.1 hypothetical protein LTR13_008377 [Exophiala sideris]KAK5053560.1 hypothetical protein LTR69_009204 [Exophiala sideris]KAK5179398.1 hypothetical protein LTR44_008237 [Eurotiomycetes sp. CCFEE 6388]